MKFKLLLPLFLLLPIIYFSQTNIQGIGIFKVGKTKASVIDSLSNKGFSVEKCDDYMFMCNNKYSQKKKIYLPTEKDTSTYPIIDSKKTFFINGYEVSKINTGTIELNFFNDLLYKIKIDDISYDLSKAIDTKYTGDLETKEKEITCSSVYGSFNRKENTFYLTFRNDSIYSQKVLSTYYNDKCEKRSLHYFFVTDKNIESEVRSLEVKQRGILKSKKESEDLNLLKDL